ncbi:uncharacterized protein LOC130899624 [Diorhabda carinulata]|uniref:uncharacterized protein LOC130899624 n=1 Tax=Diorhabda carinulata TaxID=1163345 RepID=UPI0025A221ED|nr:uncharacterized protein LOC130899624 [Diorhabda carinulata]
MFGNSIRLTAIIFLSIFIYNIHCSTDLARSRVRRRVVFTKSSKFFFRFNGKLNTLPYNQVVACGYTVRMNFDLPHDVKSRFTLFKRDIHDDISNIPNDYNLENFRTAVQGLACVMKQICKTFSNLKFSETCGLFCDIGKIIMRDEGNDALFIKNFFSKCEHYEEVCQNEVPLSTTVSYD